MRRQRQTLVQNGVQMADSGPNWMSKVESVRREAQIADAGSKWDAQKWGPNGRLWSKFDVQSGVR
jgi:hypothetical protein